MKRGIFFAVLFGAAALSAVACGGDDDGGDDGGDGGGGTSGTATGGTGGGMNVECTPGGGGACQNDDDCPAVEDGSARMAAQTCGLGCQQDDDPAMCAVACIVDEAGTSAACSACYAALVGCATENCLVECSADPAGADCTQCQIENCRGDFDACSGLDTTP